MQAKILSLIGDQLPQGVFKLHSSFDKVLNYYDHDHLVSIVLPEVGASAVSMVVHEIPAEKPLKLIIESKQIIWGPLIINKKDCPIYRSAPEIKSLPVNIDELIDLSLSTLSKSGLLFLIAQEKNQPSRIIEQKFAQKMQEGVKLFFVNPLKGAEKIKGLGFGLTPTGDDFLCGTLAALWLKNKLEKLKTENLIEEIYQISLGENLLVNSFLKQAKNGHFFAQFKAMAENLNHQENFKIKAESLAEVGDSSGAAMLLGFLLTLKEFNFETSDFLLKQEHF